MTRLPFYRRARGMTLLELVVVLAILAALSTVAVQSLSQSADQARFEMTQRTLADIRRACVGEPVSSAAAAESVRGFVADVGRMPASLDELMTNVANLPPFAVVPAAATGQPHDDVRVPRGWRGPYLQLPIGAPALGAANLRDGWGRPLVIALGGSANLLETVTSLGADGTATAAGGSANYDTDLSITMTANDFQGALVTGQVYRLDNGQRVNPTGGTIRVKLFGPDPTAASATGIVAQPADADPLTAQSGTGEYRYSFTLPTVGPRVLRVEVDDQPVGAPTYVVIRPGDTLVVDLKVP